MRLVDKMPCLYRTEKDLEQRLNGTICRYKDKAVQVLADGTRLHLRDPISGQNIAIVNPDDEDLDTSSPELGYMNLILPEKEPKLRVVYAERHPRRQYRQGICSTNVTFSLLDGRKVREHLHIPGFPEGIWLNYPGFIDMIEDVYPTLDKAFEILERGFVMAPIQNKKHLGIEDVEVPVKVVAISKSTAIEKTDSGVYQVYYKTDNVGWTTPDSRVVRVPSSDLGWIVSKFLSQFSWKVE